MTTTHITRRQATLSISATLASMALPSVAIAAPSSPPRSLSNIEVVRGFMRDFFNAHDPSTAERFCTEDYVFEAGSLGRLVGPKGYADGLAGLFQALPDVQAAE